MDCWQILGIEPTDDERAIKRAYAKQLKTTRPDDDAAAYQRLREAFDYALAIAPHICIDADGDEDEDADGDIWPSENHGQPETGQTGYSDGISAISPTWENGKVRLSKSKPKPSNRQAKPICKPKRRKKR